jgi:energy-coupling factor transport system substrate-specific component
MSWQLGAFGLLGVALVAGFAWYERDRPDARIVALVGTLAAFAALGRIAFAALPNVKPTTDIVLISGYALGGGPGFAVGAVAALTSNFFFGQGPWTPWQMAAWGATGVLGAILARATGYARRRTPPPAAGPAPIGRWPLALVCCAAGFAFTVVQDVGDWVTYSDHSSGSLAVYVGKGLGFDAVHAGGCVLFALAFGPALARSIARFARRLQVTWVEPGTVTALVAGAVVLSLAAGLPGAPPARAGGDPAGYLLAAENADGGFGGATGQPSAALFTGWAALGLAAAGEDLQRVSGGRLIAYTRSQTNGSLDPGSLERTILVVRAAGLSPRHFAGRDLLATLEQHVRGDGSIADQVNWTAFGILAERAAGAAPSRRTTAWLIRQQNGDGGYGFGEAGGSSDPDDTGAALEALGGVPGSAVARARSRAVAYLHGAQNRDGGLPSQTGGPSNAQSTAWAIQGLLAAGTAPGSVHRPGGRSPSAYLSSLVTGDGRVDYARGTDQTPVWVTGEALMALQGRPLPLLTPLHVDTVAHQRAPAPAPAVRHSAAAHRTTARPRRHPAARRTRPAHAGRPTVTLGMAVAEMAGRAGPGWAEW